MLSIAQRFVTNGMRSSSYVKYPRLPNSNFINKLRRDWRSIIYFGPKNYFINMLHYPLHIIISKLRRY
uniref:Uncharacterized protein n=1 Tax=Arundo donax TaxID=35708 RepID=A0A0A9HP35_ARUDO